MRAAREKSRGMGLVVLQTSERTAFALERPRDLNDLVSFELISNLEIAEALDREAAFESRLHLAHIVLEALERIELSRVDNDVVAQDTDHGTALDQTLEHVATGNCPDLRDVEYLPHLHESGDGLLSLRREHSGQRRLHFIHRVVDDVVVAHIHAVGRDELLGGRVGARVETDHHGIRGECEVHVRLGDGAYTTVNEVDLDLGGRQLLQRMCQRFLRTLHVRLDDQRQRLAGARGHLIEHALQLRSLLFGKLDISELTLAEQRDLARATLVAEDDHFFAGLRDIRQTLDLDRNRRTGLRHAVAVFIQHRSDTTEYRASKHDVTALERSRLNQQSRDRAATFVQPRLDDDAFG